MHMFGTMAYIKNLTQKLKLEPIGLQVKYLGDATDETGLFDGKKAYKVYGPKSQKILFATQAVFDGVTTAGESSLEALDWTDKLHAGDMSKCAPADTYEITQSEYEDDDLTISCHNPPRWSCQNGSSVSF